METIVFCQERSAVSTEEFPARQSAASTCLEKMELGIQMKEESQPSVRGSAMKIKQKQKENFILFCVLLFFILMAIVSVVWNSNSFYSNAYRPVVNEANERHRVERRQDRRGEDSKSAEPRAKGFRESDIEKKRGNRYATY
jgi:hypothetical protein